MTVAHDYIFKEDRAPIHIIMYMYMQNIHTTCKLLKEYSKELIFNAIRDKANSHTKNKKQKQKPKANPFPPFPSAQKASKGRNRLFQAQNE